jgi:hypothetical protein
LAAVDTDTRPEVGSFECDDEQVNEIWKTAAYTLRLCLQNGYIWDGVKRDRLVWIGDMHPEMLALTTLYGRVKEIERSLDFVKAQTPLPGWMNWFPTYSMWWIIIVADSYKRTQARDFSQNQITYMKDLIALMDQHVKADGEMCYPFYFLDWPSHEHPDEIHGVRAIHIIAMRKAIEFLKEFGEATTTAQGVLDKLLKVEMTPTEKKQAIAMKYFAIGTLTDKEKARLVEGNARGMSTFMSYYQLKAIASFDKAKAKEIMKEYYGAMLNKGATTFWEDFDIDWVENSGNIAAFPKKGEKDIHGDYGAHCYIGFRHSLCHGWSAGVLTYMQEEL